MKTPEGLEKEVKEKYLTIAKKRAKDYLEQLEKTIEEKKEEYYLYKKIGLGEKLELSITDEELPKEVQNSEKKLQIKGVINAMTWEYIEKELNEANWKIERSHNYYHLVRIGK